MVKENLSHTHEKLALELVSKHLNIDGFLQAEALQGGYSGAILIKIGSPNKDYVVRFLDSSAIPHHEHEIKCQQIASDQGYGPKVYFADATRGLVVMEYLQPKIFPREKHRLQEIIKVLKSVHIGPSFPPTLTIFDFIQESIQTLSQMEPIHIINLGEIKAILKIIQDAVTKFSKHTACHRDLNPNNFIYARGQFFLIDYEAAGEGDPYIDLGQIALFNCFSRVQDDKLLSMYLERPPTRLESARLSLFKQVARLFYGLEFLKNLIPEMLKLKNTPRTDKTYMELWEQICQRQLDLNASQTQMDFGLALIDDVLRYYHSNSFQREIELIQKGEP